jgi:hypothetical protein
MSAWSKIDDLRDRVAKAPAAVIEAGAIKKLDQAQATLGKSGFQPERLVILGWEILLSRRQQDGAVIWHLSVQLYPHGRSSTENDWKTVGQIAARVGAPRDPVLVPDDPSAVVHWSWLGQ